MSGTPGRIVVVGAGVAGVSAAGAARLAGYEGEIVLLGGEDARRKRREKDQCSGGEELR